MQVFFKISFTNKCIKYGINGRITEQAKGIILPNFDELLVTIEDNKQSLTTIFEWMRFFNKDPLNYKHLHQKQEVIT